MKDIRIFFRTNQEQAAELAEIAIILNISKSQIVREAIDEKIAQIKKNSQKISPLNVNLKLEPALAP